MIGRLQIDDAGNFGSLGDTSRSREEFTIHHFILNCSQDMRWDEIHQTSHISKEVFFSFQLIRQVLLCLLIWDLKMKHVLMHSVRFFYSGINCFFHRMCFYANCWKMGACFYTCKRRQPCVVVTHESGNLLSSPLFQGACPCHKTWCK